MLLTYILVCLLFGAFAVRVCGFNVTLVWACMATMAFLPRRLFSVEIGGAEQHTGLAGAQPAFLTYTFILIAGFFLAWKACRKLAWNVHVPAFIFIIFLQLAAWDFTPATAAGLLHLATAVCAATVGGYIAIASFDDVLLQRTLVISTFAVNAVQNPIVVLQKLGFDIFPTDAASAVFEGYRASGSFSHPGTYGKIAMLLLLLVLPFTSANDGICRKWAWLSIGAMIIPLTLTSSRANFAAALVAVFLWTVVLPGARSWTTRAAGLLGVLTLIAATWNVWAYRFLVGEDGSVRSRLTEIGLHQIAIRPWVGTGINSYVSTVAETQRTAAQGYPVHNIFLYVTAEIGVPAAIVFFAPVLYMFALALRSCFKSGSAGGMARSVVAFIPGFMLVGLTGWGLLSDTLPLMFFVFGFALWTMRLSRKFATAPAVDSEGRGKLEDVHA